MLASLIAEPHRQRAAILFADIHGYSKLMNKDELGTYERVIQSISLISSLIDDYGGRVVQTTGDCVLALFDEAEAALNFAVEMQREFRNDIVWNAEGDPIAFRIGINQGDVLIGETGIQGNDVNIAARIQAMAKPGGICISSAVYNSVRNATDLPIRALGRKRLKNITDPVEIFTIEFNEPGMPSLIDVTVQREPIEERADLVSVAVLPLDSLSDDPRDHHLCEGLTGDIITNLSRFRDLGIIAHHSTKIIKRQDLPSTVLLEQLGIRYVMGGALQRKGAKIRLRVELIDATSQSILWSDRFSGDLIDIFEFQDEVTDIVSARLATQIAQAERRRVAQLQIPDIRAYGLILRGQDLYTQFRKESNRHARRLFEQATEIDPKFGRSYAAMSRTFNLDWRYAWSSNPSASLDTAVELAKSAIDYDPLDARGFGELGFANLYKKQHDESLAAYERALQLNPNDADLLAEMGDALAYAGQGERAVSLLQRAMVLNPYFPDWYLWNLGEAYFHLDDYERTIGTLHRMQDKSEAHRLLASSHAHLGQLDEARHHAAEVLRVHPTFSVDHWATIPPDKDPEKLQIFIEGLRIAGLK